MPRHDNQLERGVPVNAVDTGSDHDDLRQPQDGIALCLSGGGYRAMLFHLGALWRLNELGYLPTLARISSVSGGSITAGVLGLKWAKLTFAANGVSAAFDAEVVQPIRSLASKTIDEGAVLGGILLPGSISDKVTDAYRKYLFGKATLQDLPGDSPRFVINATSVQTGALFRFSRPFVADYRVGMISNPTIELAVAVAASSAFPPVLSPLKLELDPSSWAPASGKKSEDLHREPFLSEAVLTDGGVYDNLGLETAWKTYKTVLVSNGGGKMQAEEEPHRDWARHSMRINDIIDNQVRSLRARQVIGAFEAGERKGTYWGIRTDVGDYHLADCLACDFTKTIELANTPTRLKRLDAPLQERLINWGYAVCDAAMRKWVEPGGPAPPGFPYGGGIG
ncbi:MAG: patatin [Acidobacteria bacterium RIFCSPLOWO2_02_FULL_67_36]|nr:MAG: patatin [Acidobacteria bacterium RIFCSPLOWO2_02_FULL_67_36]OFW25483.1 MAG: patatin [Acidobacteria bacterium RIFCSPLOWO2_12_FULL_66_21]